MRGTKLMVCGWLVGSACTASIEGPAGVEATANRLPATLSGYVSAVRPRSGLGAPVQVDAALLPEAGEYLPRILAKVATGASPCPPPNAGWTARRLFDAPALPGAPPGLLRYCLYEWAGAGAPALPAAAQSGVEFEPDHMAVTPATAPSLVELTQDGYAVELRTTIKQAPLHGPAPSILPRLILLDTSPTSPPSVGGWTRLGRNDHGYALANIAHNATIVEVETSSGTIFEAVADVRTRLALDLYVSTSGEVVRDPVGGGDFGTIALLAEAVHAEVERWVADGQEQPLILNLSLGWNPIWEGGDVDYNLWPLDVQAAHDAIYEASCRGAIVIAAAGNRSGGPTGHSGPILPAGWEVRPLDASLCADLLGGPAANFADVDDAPMIYAVGAVDEHLEDLAVSRANSRPRRVAYGDHATDTDHLGLLTPILTGTSVSAVVVASAVAVIWHNLPSEEGFEILSGLEDGGPAAGPVASAFCPSGGCGAAGVVDLCSAVRQACEVARPIGSCARVISPVSCGGPPVDGSPDPVEAARFVAATPSVTLSFPYAPRTAGACGPGTVQLFHEQPWRADDPCPSAQYYEFAVEPWTEPQPTHDICPPCYIDTTAGVVFLEWEGYLGTMDSLTLSLQHASGAVRTYTTTRVPPTDAITYTVDPAIFVGMEKAWITGVMGETSYSAAVELR
jgi:hypothetical protein